ncbi:PhzF family phenazine biosynthesis protein [Vibrio sp. D404a]|uniref:PhzF family phenazine biosynthesis protein n=1 Tax=unclassified Vibrio TaxID=2614977 RepID=UPI0025529E4B|nr:MULTISPECIES: PhzF family phenazine biosynthesis protein [unclassified Vibrio]MDK9736030.1 PhzF family phenazine biosynthesis protein [Vibrio sp. D404a]MDK9797804.1 PhzF family phenazine biosynthesis protein [Vibrio sp. D449a]
MDKIEVFLVNAFTKDGSGGNPAGVVLNADNLNDKDKLRIAQTIGYSETAFVTSDEEVDFEVSFFTTTGEVDFCGHATLATFSVLHQKGFITDGQYRQRTKAGILPVSVNALGEVTMEQALPTFGRTFSNSEMSGLIGIDEKALEPVSFPAQVVSTGLPDLIIQVPTGYLDKVNIDEAKLIEFSKEHELVGAHVFELSGETEITASCRNFAPLFGISEESATGSASGALSCHLDKYLPAEHSRSFVFEQGRAMGALSQIFASVDSNEDGIQRVKVGGVANVMGLKIVGL